MILLVSLFIHPGQEVAFRQFEGEAARIMARYNGRIQHVIHPTATTSESPLPYEIHLVTFPSMSQFQAYRNDPDLAQLAPLRQSAITHTEIIFGEAGEPYSTINS
jgi:uncharacterized protein (DUF1330 family)